MMQSICKQNAQGRDIKLISNCPVKFDEFHAFLNLSGLVLAQVGILCCQFLASLWQYL